MFDEDFEIKIGPAKCLLNTLGFTVSTELNNSGTYNVYDEKENLVGFVKIYNNEQYTAFNVGSENLSIGGKYKFDHIFKELLLGEEMINYSWTINFEVTGQGINCSYMNGELSLESSEFNPDKGFDYKGHLDAIIENTRYQEPIQLYMMSEGSILAIDKLVDHLGEEDNIRVSFFEDSNKSYASNRMKRMICDENETLVNLSYSVFSNNGLCLDDDGVVDNYGDIKSFIQTVEYDDMADSYHIAERVFEHNRMGIDSDELEINNKASIIQYTGKEMLDVIAGFNEELSNGNYHILNRLAGLLYRDYSYDQILKATSIKKEDYVSQDLANNKEEVR